MRQILIEWVFLVDGKVGRLRGLHLVGVVLDEFLSQSHLKRRLVYRL